MKCPICNAPVPFSLQMHMLAAHTPNSGLGGDPAPGPSHDKPAKRKKRPFRPRARPG